jgi:hypothetical protein
MSVKEAVEKNRLQLGFNSRLPSETPEVEIAEVEESDPLEGILTKEERDFIRDYKAEIDSNPAIQKLRQDLVIDAVRKERARMGF